jgi:serine/threonine-protein kinase RsbW
MTPLSKQVFPAHYDQLDRIRDFVGDYARSSGMVDRDVYAIQLAVDEACSNIIEHAYEGVLDGRIEISCESRKSNLHITIFDWGKSFDPSQVNAPDFSDDLSERKIGGLGIFLMRKMMDKVQYHSVPGDGNQLELVKMRRRSKSKSTKKGRRPGWRELLDLAVQLFESSSLVVQRDLILEMVTELMEGEVSLWLDESHFRLPNSTTNLFPEEPTSPTMRCALESGKRVVLNQKGPLIATPIKSQDMVIGVLQVWRRRGLPFKRSDMDALEALTSHIAVALLASHQLAVEQFRIGQLNLVRKVSSQITNFTDLNELCNQVTRLIQKTF